MTSVTGSCHCGAVHFDAAYAPRDINDCQCTHCQKRGVLWAYYHPADIKVSGQGAGYMSGDRSLVVHFCATCGCTTHWTSVDPSYERMAINTRLLPPEAVAGAVIRQSPGPR